MDERKGLRTGKDVTQFSHKSSYYTDSQSITKGT